MVGITERASRACATLDSARAFAERYVVRLDVSPVRQYPYRMVKRHMPEMPLLDRVKIQAEVLVPLFHACERELGPEGARTVIGDALREHFRAQVREQWVSTGKNLDVFLEQWAKNSGADDALTMDIKQMDDTHIDFDVTACKYEEFWRSIDEPELGFLLQCASDFAVDGVVEPIHLQRTQTRMQGASHCDFRITLDRS